MSICFGCHFYESGYMSNRCEYFQSEYYREPDECEAFSADGNLTQEQEDKIFKATGGYFGKPWRREE